jgi:hypothetical protein
MAALIVLPFMLSSQNHVYKEDYNIDLRIKEPNAFMGRTCASISNEKIYFTNASAGLKDKKRILNVYDLNNGKSETIEFEMKNDAKFLLKENIAALEVIDDKLVILTDPTIFVFKIVKGKAIFFQKTANRKFFNHISKTSNGTLVLSINYNFHPTDSPDKHVWAKYDISRNEVFDTRGMDESNSIFTHYVNSWMSVCNNTIAYSNTLDYTIFFYNEDFKKIDSIKSDLLAENKKYANILNKPFEFSKDHIAKIQHLDDTALTRIQKIYYLDTTHLLVTLKLPGVKQLKLNLWAKKGNTWDLTKTDSIPYFYEAGKVYTEKNNSITGFYGNADALLPDGKGNLYYLYCPFIDKIITNSFDLQADYTEKINELIKTDNVTYGIKRFSFN